MRAGGRLHLLEVAVEEVVAVMGGGNGAGGEVGAAGVGYTVGLAVLNRRL